MKNLLLVIDCGLVDLFVIKYILDVMEVVGFGCVMFNEVDFNLNEVNLIVGVVVYKVGGYDGVIVFGGGFGLDFGKMVVFMVG